MAWQGGKVHYSCLEIWNQVQKLETPVNLIESHVEMLQVVPWNFDY